MSVHKVGRGEVGAHEAVLAANTIDTVEFASNLSDVEVVSDGSAAIYFTVDGDTPAVKGPNCFYLPAGGACSREVASKANQPTVVQLISTGTPTYSVARVSK
jgi:endonuclease YncB( thermonuclease family)